MARFRAITLLLKRQYARWTLNLLRFSAFARKISARFLRLIEGISLRVKFPASERQKFARRNPGNNVRRGYILDLKGRFMGPARDKLTVALKIRYSPLKTFPVCTCARLMWARSPETVVAAATITADTNDDLVVFLQRTPSSPPPRRLFPRLRCRCSPFRAVTPSGNAPAN